MVNNARDKLRLVPLYLAVALIPFWVTMIHSIISGMNLFIGKPHNSDEFCYWRVLYSFHECGFDFASTCGYLNCDARVGPLGEHGLATLFAWGVGPFVLGGVNSHTLFLWNIIVLSFAIGAFFFIVKPNIWVSFWIVLLIAGNGVLCEQWYSHMMEMPCLAVIILYYAFQLKYEKTGKHLYFIIAALLCAYASYMRICYIILIVPMLIQVCKNNKKKYNPFPLFMYFAVFLFIRSTQLLFMKSSDSFLSNVSSMGLLEIVKAIISRFVHGIVNYFSLTNGENIEIGQRYYQLFLLVFLFVIALVKIENNQWKLTFRLDYFSTAVSLLGLLIMMMALYDIADWRDVRTTMPYAVGVTIWLIVRCYGGMTSEELLISRYCKIALLFGLSCTTIIFAVPRYRINHPLDRWETRKYEIEWVDMIDNKSAIFCIYNAEISGDKQFQLYEALPPRVGIQIAKEYSDLISQADKLSYILTSCRIRLDGWEIIAENKDYGFIYCNKKEQMKLYE